MNRLMVAAKLLTYRLDVPQEGRLSHDGTDLRIAVMPTNHGLRVVVRLRVVGFTAANILTGGL